MKNLTAISSFERGVTNWKPESCQCRLCESYREKVLVKVCFVILLLFWFIFSSLSSFTVWLTLIVCILLRNYSQFVQFCRTLIFTCQGSKFLFDRSFLGLTQSTLQFTYCNQRFWRCKNSPIFPSFCWKLSPFQL